MDKNIVTYRIFKVIGLLLITEILFWCIAYFTLLLFDYFSAGNAGEKLIFISPQYAYLSALIPGVYFLFYLVLKRRNTLAKQYSNHKLSSSYLSPVSNWNAFLRFFLFKTALSFLIIAALQPAFGSKPVNAKLKGVELVFAIDISVSMNTRDMDKGLSRLQIAKRSINQFINLAQSGKVGMVVFAGSAYPQLPLTSDFGAAKMYTKELTTDFISNQGTNIGLALDMSADFFTREKTKKVIVLLSDGEDHELGVTAAIDRLNKKGIALYVLGLGSKQGGLIPKNILRPSLGYIKDNNGKMVVSSVNEEMLKDLAKKANGKAVVSSSDFPNISSLLAEINSFESTKSIKYEFEVKENRYALFLFIGILFLVILILIEEFKATTRLKRK